jgi:hypothetical protein
MNRSDALRAAQEARKARRAAAEEEKPRATATARVTTQDVFTALVARLLSDDTLATQVRDDLADVAHQRAADRAARRKPS